MYGMTPMVHKPGELLAVLQRSTKQPLKSRRANKSRYRRVAWGPMDTPAADAEAPREVSRLCLRAVPVAGGNFGGADGSGGGGGGGGYTAGIGGYGQWDVNTALPQYGVSYCSPGGSGGGGSSAYNTDLVTSINESGAVGSCSGAAATMALAWDSPTTLQARQLVQSPVPINLRPPFTFSYSGNNG